MATFAMDKPKIIQNLEDRQLIGYFPVASGQSFAAGALLKLNNDGSVQECGDDPTAILGIALTASTSQFAPSSFTGKSVVPVLLLNEGVVVEMTMSGAWAGNEIGGTYGVAKDSGSGSTNTGYWYVDRSDTTNARVRVLELVRETRTGKTYSVGDTNVRVKVQFLPAYLQRLA